MNRFFSLALAVCLFAGCGVIVIDQNGISIRPDKKTIVEPVNPRPVSHEFRCLIIEDVAQRASLPRTQLAMLTGKNVRDFLKANCIKDDSGNPQYRIVDQSTVSDLTGVWKQMADKSTTSKLPKLILQNGTDYLDKPLPTDWAELQSHLEKYAGVTQ